jgi:hypothetical protein
MELRIKRFLRLAYEIGTQADNLPEPFLRTRSLFIHIPKAAGTSIVMELYGCQVGHRTLRE